jgi:transcriptional regulator with XRE-family HTH domain
LLVLPILATPHIVACVSATQNAASLLRDLREQQGRSLRSAAADIGIAPSQLSRLERGQRGLAPEVSERLSDYYGVPSETLSLARGEVPLDILQILREHPDEIERLRSQYGSRLSE